MAWISNRTRRELQAICPKLTKKTLKVHKNLGKAASILIVQMQTEKVDPKKFLYFKKMPGFNLSECPCRRGLQSAKHLLVECRLQTQKKNQIWEKDRKKAAFGRISVMSRYVIIPTRDFYVYQHQLTNLTSSHQPRINSSATSAYRSYFISSTLYRLVSNISLPILPHLINLVSTCQHYHFSNI